MSPQKPPLWSLLAALLMSLGYSSFYFLPVLDPGGALGHVTLVTALFFLYLPAAWAARHLQSHKWLACLLAFGLLYRLLLFPLAPSMSDDFYRYIWDGKVQAHGYNPYIEPPNSTLLNFLHDAHIHPFINHPNVRTVYPPTAQLIFTLSYLLDDKGALGLKFWLLLADLLTLFLLFCWLKRRDKPPGLLLLYAWCPVPIVELMLDAHIDGLALPFVLGTMLAAQSRRPWLTGFLLACGLMVKPLPLFLVPLLLWHFRWRGSLKMCVSAAATGFISGLPYLKAGPLIFLQILHYSRHWHFNGPFFKFFDQWFVADAIRLTLALCIIGCSLLAPFLRISFEKRFVLPLAAYLLLTPTLYPWYFVWLAPWLVIAPAPWLFWFAGTISLAHTVHFFFGLNGRWSLPALIVCVEFIPLFALLLAQFWLVFGKPQLASWLHHRAIQKQRLNQLQSQVESLQRQITILQQQLKEPGSSSTKS